MSDCKNKAEELHETFARNFCEDVLVNVVSSLSLSVLDVTEHRMEQPSMSDLWKLHTTG